MPFLKLQKIEYSDNIIRIYASIKSRRSKCPICGRYSKRVHDFYFRTISDLPVSQYRTVILLKTRKFRCGNNRCHRKVFSEQAPTILRYSRRTSRAAKILETFAIELTGRLGSIIGKTGSIDHPSPECDKIKQTSEHQVICLVNQNWPEVVRWSVFSSYPQNTKIMDEKQRKAYIKELFKHVKTDSILIINAVGHLGRLWCPFKVLVIVDVHPLKKGQEKSVIAVKMADNLVDVYIVEDKAFYHYNFSII